VFEVGVLKTQIFLSQRIFEFSVECLLISSHVHWTHLAYCDHPRKVWTAVRNISLFGVCKIWCSLQDSTQNAILQSFGIGNSNVGRESRISLVASVVHRDTRNSFPLIKTITSGRILKRMQMRGRLAVDWIEGGSHRNLGLERDVENVSDHASASTNSQVNCIMARRFC
jgi:hypothetical protein